MEAIILQKGFLLKGCLLAEVLGTLGSYERHLLNVFILIFILYYLQTVEYKIVVRHRLVIINV